MDIEKIRAVGQEILREPRRFNMETWGSRFGEFDWLRHVKSGPPCGTICCFAGEWSMLAEGFTPEQVADRDHLSLYRRLSVRCQEDLEMPNRWLLNTACWPPRLLRGCSRLTPGSSKYAAYFVNVVLEDYIATDGWEAKP